MICKSSARSGTFRISSSKPESQKLRPTDYYFVRHPGHSRPIVAIFSRAPISPATAPHR